MTLLLTPTTRLGKATQAAYTLTRNGRKIGTVTQVSPSLWVAALDKPQTVITGTSLRDVREKLGRM